MRFPLATVRALFTEAQDALASLVFPAPCRVCGEVLLNASRIPICRECLESLRPLAGPMCQKCGRPILSDFAAQLPRPLCGLCRRNVYHFDLARSFAAYNEPMVHAITLLKYHEITPLGGWFAARLAELVAAQGDSFAADVVVPVPLHATRLRERGYNQADLIAKPLAKRLRLRFSSLLLVRTKPRPDKLKLTRHERWETVRGAYAIRQRAQVDNLHVMLVDDVFTTGATLDACANALRRAGAARVVCLTVARALSIWAGPGPARESRTEVAAGELSK